MMISGWGYTSCMLQKKQLMDQLLMISGWGQVGVMSNWFVQSPNDTRSCRRNS